MKRLLIVLLSLGFVMGCGKKKEEVTVTKTNEPVNQSALKNTDSIKEKVESATEEEEESKPPPDGNKSSGNRNEYINLKASETADKVGSKAVVTGYVADVVIREKVAYLNFDGKYPRNTFTAVIFPDKFEVFGDLMSYKNKTIEVRGKIGTYSGKPQIILNNKNQIRIVN
jgi:hypothetical protein